MTESVVAHRRAVSGWIVLKWAIALCAVVVAVFPIWWMVNVVFAQPGEPVSINPRLYPTSLGAGLAKIRMILAETDYLRAYYISLAYSLLTIGGVLLIGSRFSTFRASG
jgi:multiple sugar transport system permease protein